MGEIMTPTWEQVSKLSDEALKRILGNAVERMGGELDGGRDWVTYKAPAEYGDIKIRVITIHNHNDGVGITQNDRGCKFDLFVLCSALIEEVERMEGESAAITPEALEAIGFHVASTRDGIYTYRHIDNDVVVRNQGRLWYIGDYMKVHTMKQVQAALDRSAATNGGTEV